MFCVNCGQKIPEDSRFCVSCGAPAPQDDPALRPPAPAADRELEWAMSMPEEPAPRPDPVRRSAPGKRLKKRRSPAVPLVIVLAVLILTAVVLGVLSLLNRAPDPVTLSEHLGDFDWSFASVCQLKDGETVRKAETDDDAAAMEVWEAIAELPFTPIEDSWAEQTLTERGIFLTLAGGDDLLHLHVSKDGALRIRGEDIPTLCAEDAAEVYDALKDFLPKEESFPLDQVIPAAGITSASILHYGPEDDLYYTAFLTDPGDIGQVTSMLRQIAPEAGKGYHLEELERMVLSLTVEGGKEIRIEILSDGCGDIPMGVWEYGICHESLFLILRDLMYSY